MSIALHRSDFPHDFKFGAATSAYQIEGHDQGNAGSTHWDDFARTPGNVTRGDRGALACDHLARWQEDLDLVRDGNFDVYRFSLSWARILPQGNGTPNAQGLDHYDRLIDGMLERGIQPAATLYHWELPSELADRGGWRNRDIAHWFADYTALVMERFGDRLWSVAPINEPWCVSWLSHFEGHHAPGLRDIRATARAMHHVLLAHGQAIQVMRDMGQGNLGAICNLEIAEPADATASSRLAADRNHAIYNRFFLSGMFLGRYPDLVLEGIRRHLPNGWEQDFDVITAPLDWIGINYYTRKLYRAADGPWPGAKEVTGPLPKTALGWEIYPEGLTRALRMVAQEFTGDLPIYITENGMAGAVELGDDPLFDPDRIAYLSAHLEQVKQGLAEGLPIHGYYSWSLLDNFEWAHGYAPRFGLVHVDYTSMERRPKTSYQWLKAALDPR